GVHDARRGVAVGGGDVQVGGGGYERPGGPAQDRPGEPEVLGEQVPCEERQDADVDADRDYPRGRAEPRDREVLDGREGADAAKGAEQAEQWREDRNGDLHRARRADETVYGGAVLASPVCLHVHVPRRVVDSQMPGCRLLTKVGAT